MSKIINSFPYVMAQLVFHGVAPDTESLIGFLCRGSLILSEPCQRKLTDPLHYGKLLIILHIKAGNNMFSTVLIINNY